MYSKFLSTLLVAGSLAISMAQADTPPAPKRSTGPDAKAAALVQEQRQKELDRKNPKSGVTVSKGTPQMDTKGAERKNVDGIPASSVSEDAAPVAEFPVVAPKKKGFTLGDLNPFRWIFKPVTDMDQALGELQGHVGRLEKPISDLPTPMRHLREGLAPMNGQLDGMNANIGATHGDLIEINGGMKSVDKRLGHMEKQIQKMYKPIVELKDPVIALRKPLKIVEEKLKILAVDLKDLKDTVQTMTVTIFFTILLIGVFIIFGTPVAAILAWGNRRWLMDKLGKVDVHEGEDPLAEPADAKEMAAAGSSR